MERVNLLSTDQSSSEVKMTTTGQPNHTGTRTRAAKGLFSHFMLLAGVMLIALLTSGKALANDYTITLSGSNLSLEGAQGNTLTQSTDIRTFTLVAAEGYKLPEVGDITVSITNGSTIDNGAEDSKWSYAGGVITLGSSVDLTNGITVAADGVELGHDATLSALTYSNDNISSGSPQTVDNFSQEPIPTIELAYNNALEGVTITMAGTPTDDNATISYSHATISDGEGQATITVTAEDGETQKEYVVNFKVANDKLQSITVPTITLSKRVSTADDALAILNADPNNSFAVVTVGGQSDITLPVTWTFDGTFNNVAEASNNFTWTIAETALTEKNLDQNNVDLSATAAVTNAAASDDATLKSLVYKIGDAEETIDVSNDNNDTPKSISVDLPASTPKTAEITIVPIANDEKAAVASTDNFKKALNANKADIVFTVTPENGQNARTITVSFTRTPSDVVTLSSLQYKIGTGDLVDVDGFDSDDANGATYDVKLPFGTAANAQITIEAKATDENATVAGATEVTLSEGAGNTTLTVTAENTSGQQSITVNFSTLAEQVTNVVVPEKFTLAEEADENTSVKAIAQLEAMSDVTLETTGGASTTAKLSWEYKTSDNGDAAYAGGHGQKNNFRWTVKNGAGETLKNLDGEEATGLTAVANYIAAITEDTETVTIDSNNPYTEIGSEDAEAAIKIENVTVSTVVDELTFNKVAVSGAVTVSSAVPVITLNNTSVAGKLDLTANVGQIVLANASIGEVALASTASTTLALQESSTIGKISNDGELTLTNSEILPASVSPRSMLMDTRAAVATEVINNGTFTDETATIFTVTGAANVDITRLPTSQTTTGKKAELSVTATAADDATITYQWQKQNGSAWDDISENGTAATLSIAKVSNGTTSYRCEVKSTKEGAQTILYTPAASVTFKTAGDPTPSDPTPTPSVKTYTVTLKKVTGATFSQGETTKVDEGDNFSFTIKLDKDYDQSKPVVKVGTTTYQPDAKGVYTIKNISKDITIEVSGIVKNAATGVGETAQDAVRVWGEGSTLYIHTPEAAEVYVISGAGVLLRELKAVPGDQNLQLPAGFYIVRVGTYTAKVIIR